MCLLYVMCVYNVFMEVCIVCSHILCIVCLLYIHYVLISPPTPHTFVGLSHPGSPTGSLAECSGGVHPQVPRVEGAHPLLGQPHTTLQDGHEPDGARAPDRLTRNGSLHRAGGPGRHYSWPGQVPPGDSRM